MVVQLVKPASVQVAGSSRSGPGPIPELDRLLTEKPNVRVAIVQGSFDWFHSGHLALLEGVLSAGEKRGQPFDAVVVVPSRPHDYGDKSYLVTSYDRRLNLVRAAVESSPKLKHKVVVSDLSRRTEAKPAQLVDTLAQAYPSFGFSYALGADSVALSEKWPKFRETLGSSKVELLALSRAGYDSTPGVDWHSAKPVSISSSEIRRALAEGDVSGIRGRVPPSTFEALEAQVATDRANQRSGAGAVGLPKRSDIPFAKIRAEVPAGAIDILDFVAEKDLSDAMRNHLAGVQRLINARAQELENSQFTKASRQLDKAAGQTDKTILDARVGMHLSGRILHKEFEPETAAKVEFLTVLANVLGMPTSLALRHEPEIDGTKRTGVSLRLVEDVSSSIQIYERLPQLDSKSIECTCSPRRS